MKVINAVMQFFFEILVVSESIYRCRSGGGSPPSLCRYATCVLCVLSFEVKPVMRHHSSGAPSALVTALGMLERLGSLALLANA